MPITRSVPPARSCGVRNDNRRGSGPARERPRRRARRRHPDDARRNQGQSGRPADPRELNTMTSSARRSSAPRALDGTPFELDRRHVPSAAPPSTSGGDSRFRTRATSLDGRELVLDGSISPSAGGAVIVFRDVTAEHERDGAERAVSLRALQLDPDPAHASRTHDPRADLGEPGVSRPRRLRARDGDRRPRAAVPLVGAERADATVRLRRRVDRSEQVYRRKDGRPLPVEVSVARDRRRRGQAGAAARRGHATCRRSAASTSSSCRAGSWPRSASWRPASRTRSTTRCSPSSA